MQLVKMQIQMEEFHTVHCYVVPAKQNKLEFAFPFLFHCLPFISSSILPLAALHDINNHKNNNIKYDKKPDGGSTSCYVTFSTMRCMMPCSLKLCRRTISSNVTKYTVND